MGRVRHPEYERAVAAWSRARDVLAGEDSVKAAGTCYLPRLDSQTDEEYSAYKARACFFGVTGQTLNELVSLVFRRPPACAHGNTEPMRRFVADSDGWGLPFPRYARRVLEEVLTVGRAGSLILCDPPPSSSPHTDALNSLPSDLSSVALAKEEASAKEGQLSSALFSPSPSAKRLDNSQPSTLNHQLSSALYRAEDILDWEAERDRAGVRLSRLVLAERGWLRVLRMENGVCVQEWMEAQEDGSWSVRERVEVKRGGVELSFIPFVFHGPADSRPEIGKLPLADLIAANLDHYRLDADYKHGLHFAALPTAWVSGFDKAGQLRIGSSTAWVSESADASAGFLEFSGAGLAHLEKAMEKVEQRMTSMGARMLEVNESNPPVQHSTLNPQLSTPLSGLGSIVASLNESLSRVLQLAHWWYHGGELNGAVSFAMNTDLGARAMSGDEITAVVEAWRAGAISRDSMLERLKRGEVLPDGRSVAQERALIHGKAKVEA